MSDIRAMYDEAEKLKDEGKLDEAIQKLQSLLTVAPDHLLSHLALAVLYGRVGNHDQAIIHGQRACELDPHDAFNFTALSVTYQRAWQGTQRPEYIQLAETAMARAHMIQGH
jgi:tetratricopeptide (TPR) repeat protein